MGFTQPIIMYYVHLTPFKSGSEMGQARLAERPSKRVACLITLETSDKEHERGRQIQC